MTRMVILGGVLALAVPSIAMVQARAIGEEESALAAEQQGATDPDVVFWLSIDRSTDPADFKAYLEKFPAGIFSGLARNRLAALEAETTGADTQTCDDTPSDAGCWTKAYDREGVQTDCLVWNPDPGTYPRATWTGACAAGFAHGFGTLEWQQGEGRWTVQGRGVLQNGFQMGRWQLTHDDGLKVDAEYAPDGRLLRSWAPRR